MEFLAVKICYFFSAGSKYTLMAFLVVFLTENGLNVAQAGQVTAVRYIVEVIGAVVLNVLTDRFKKYAKIILMIYLYYQFFHNDFVDAMDSESNRKGWDFIFLILGM